MRFKIGPAHRGLIEGEPDFFAALNDDVLFQSVRLSPAGHGLIWSDEIDLAIEEVWLNGT